MHDTEVSDEDDEAIYMWLSAEIAIVLCDIDSDWKQFVCADGRILVRVLKAMYGLPQSAKRWFDDLSGKLIKLGYKQSSSDKCVFAKQCNGRECIMTVHVDDMLVFVTDNELMTELFDGLNRMFFKVTMREGMEHDYLGMTLKFDYSGARGKVEITQPEYTRKLLESYNVNQVADTPHTAHLFDVRENDKAVDKRAFLSLVMKLMWLAKRSRPDILLPVSYLATKCQSPVEDDSKKLNRVLAYINATPEKGIVLEPDSLEIVSYIDASFGTHVDGKSHTGITVHIGEKSAPVFCQSVKQKLVTKSSTEAELVGINDGISQVLWLRSLMQGLGKLKKSPTVIYQDNQSTMQIAERGAGAKGRTKHIDIRYFYVKEKIELQEIVLKYKAGEEMVADMLTKAVPKDRFFKLRKLLMNFSGTSTARSTPARGVLRNTVIAA